MAAVLLKTYALPALVTLVASAVYFGTSLQVGRARGQHKVSPPAITGPPAFERALRVQTNTLEQLAFFLPVFWLAALFNEPKLASAFGFIWVGGRTAYAIGYARSAAQRGPGFLIALFAAAVLFGLALTGVIAHLG
jgi:glutathione S-transferase